MTWLLVQAVILGVVEGITEFLPVSSTGHLIVAGDLLRFDPAYRHAFEFVIQLGAILAICWLYRQRLWEAVCGMWRPGRDRRFVLLLVLAFIPSAILGLALDDLAERYLLTTWVVAVMLVVGGIAILLIEGLVGSPRHQGVEALPPRTAFFIGCCQALAIVPGVSRSGATIMGALALGSDRKTAAEFSFFLAIPTMLGAATVKAVKHRDSLAADGGDGWLVIGVGFVVSFLVALLVVRWFLAFITRHDFRPFAWYRIAAGGIILVLLALGWIAASPPQA